MKLTRLMRVSEGDIWHARTEPHPELETWGFRRLDLWAHLRDEAALRWRWVQRPAAVERERQEQARRERLAYVLRPAVDGPLPKDWIDFARVVPCADVFKALGVGVSRGRWTRCPACLAESAPGARGIVAPISIGWICNRCKVRGDGIAAVAYALNGSPKVTPTVGRWFAARWRVT